MQRWAVNGSEWLTLARYARQPDCQDSADGMMSAEAADVELGVASSFVCDPISRWLGVWLDALGGSTLRPRLRFAGYQQLQQELRQPVAFRGAPPAHTTPLPPAQGTLRLLTTDHAPRTTHHAPCTTCVPRAHHVLTTS